MNNGRGKPGSSEGCGNLYEKPGSGEGCGNLCEKPGCGEGCGNLCEKPGCSERCEQRGCLELKKRESSKRVVAWS